MAWSMRPNFECLPSTDIFDVDVMNYIETREHARFATWMEHPEENRSIICLSDVNGNCMRVFDISHTEDPRRQLVIYYTLQNRRKETWINDTTRNYLSTYWRWDIQTDEFCQVTTVEYQMTERREQPEISPGVYIMGYVRWLGMLYSDSGQMFSL